jgi:hypothetical protein
MFLNMQHKRYNRIYYIKTLPLTKLLPNSKRELNLLTRAKKMTITGEYYGQSFFYSHEAVMQINKIDGAMGYASCAC